MCKRSNLNGAYGANLFVLGNQSKVFYNDDSVDSSGSNDYAIIEDFSLIGRIDNESFGGPFIIESDRIQLKGSKQDYTIVQNADNTEIYYQNEQNTPELIAVVYGDSFSDFDTGFVFV